jgi:hypothetical protein
MLLVNKLLSLVESKSDDTRCSVTVALVGAFADLLESLHFTEAERFTKAQLHLMSCFVGGEGGGELPGPILVSAIERALVLSDECRRYFIRDDRAGLLPQGLDSFSLVLSEKRGLALTEALYHIANVVLQPTLAAESRGCWITSFVSDTVASQLRDYLHRETVEQMVHRTHNLGLEGLRFTTDWLSSAFSRENQPRTIWPDAAFLDSSADSDPYFSLRRPH